jgi:hypothetical protein
MSTTLPIEIYDMLEAKVGKEEAREVGKILTASFDAIEKKAEAVVVQMKAQIKEELTKELATKADIAELKGDIKELRAETRGEFNAIRAETRGEFNAIRAEMKGNNMALRLEQRIIFVILASIILLTNPKALELIAKLFGLAK